MVIFRLIGWAGRIALISSALVLFMRMEIQTTLILLLFATTSTIFEFCKHTLPAYFDPLFLLASLINAAGWMFNWYEGILWYDEFAHIFTTFVITLPIGFWYMNYGLTRHLQHPYISFGIIGSTGTSLGVIWEFLEWLGFVLFVETIYMTLSDTLSDLFFDVVGALLASRIIFYILSHRAKSPVDNNIDS